ncbi:YopJ family acetyltransferase [Paraburkholderia phenoliruptrix]|uniref:YopJ family acetyltransferase n=1 Tax=Paraburkholderia phenoliruptrix TaxID=252970 RepID=UPI00142EF370|nr:YopJ family acetyltransferase [Paraburkholderia phenoliruptrix]MBW0447161.1 hypothetical protein [Paraburkholderia phenoliruptrix]MBW9101456.1 hypothetical protein [Paraburkholderia phenoliruptrix]
MNNARAMAELGPVLARIGMAESSSATGGTRSSNPADAALPDRLAQKIASVEAVMQNVRGPLRTYAEAAIERVRHRTADAPSFADLDAAHLDALVATENQRNPGLNLEHFSHQDDFVAAIRQGTRRSFRAIFPYSNPQTQQPERHHVMADVRRHANGATTVVVTESGVIFAGRGNQLAKHNQIVLALNEVGVDSNHVAVIETQAQKSNDDCVMYSLNYALKAHKNQRVFDEFHARLQRQANPDRTGLSRGATSVNVAEKEYRMQMLYSHAAHGADVLTTDFYKHGASLQQAEQLMKREDGRMSGPVNSDRHAVRETLVERNLAFRVPRPKAPDQGASEGAMFSASIDGFRLQEIARALTSASTAAK